MSYTPGPWKVKFAVIEHVKNSPNCRATCGTGVVPQSVRIEDGHEIHTLEPDTSFVDSIIAENGSRVVYLGMDDYDDQGHISPDDALVIATAPELLEALKKVRTCLAAHGYCSTEEREVLKLAAVAIAKAEGAETPVRQKTE
jgi:hypothetical protein